MSWNAKPSGAYSIDSTEALENMDMIYNILTDANMVDTPWALTAICGMLGNINAESGFNPWRWQSDSVTYGGGYGLVQFTPAKDTENPNRGYIDGFGTNYAGYAPNMSVTGETTGASAFDGQAQILAVDDNAGGKYTSYKRHCNYTDITSVNTFDDYKQCEDLWVATVGWLFYYEAPEVKTYDVAKIRFQYAQKCWEHFTQDPPIPPQPPAPSRQRKLPLYMYLRRL